MIKYLLILLPLTASAAAPQKSFTLLAKYKIDKTWYRIYEKDKKWICESKSSPYFEAVSNPLADLNWSALEKEAAMKMRNCKMRIAFENALGSKKKIISTCATQPETTKLYKQISDLCRSKI